MKKKKNMYVFYNEDKTQCFKYEVEHSEYSKMLHSGFATVVTPYGRYRGIAKLHPEDEAYESPLFGEELAIDKALLLALRDKKKILNGQIKILQIAELNKENKKIKPYLFKVKQEKIFIQNAITTLYKRIKESPERRINRINEARLLKEKASQAKDKSVFINRLKKILEK